jgi:hypothetical protein
MVVKISTEGLVVTTQRESLPSLDELLACCGWPLVAEANLRRLHRELAVHNPDCVLFWLDELTSVAPTAQLVAWLRQRGARPYRVAVAYQLEHAAEAELRSAGAHSFLPISGDVTSAVAGALWPMLESAVRTASKPVGNMISLSAGDVRQATAEVSSDAVHPP